MIDHPATYSEPPTESLFAEDGGSIRSQNKMKTTIKWTFGNFDVTVDVAADVSGPAAEMLLKSASINILQRGPSGAAEKAIAGYDKRPAGFQRNSIPYSLENAEKLVKLFTGIHNLNPEGEPAFHLAYDCISVTDHALAATTTARKFTDEKATLTKWLRPEESDKLAARLAKIGIASLDSSDESIMAGCLALDAFFKAQKAAL